MTYKKVASKILLLFLSAFIILHSAYSKSPVQVMPPVLPSCNTVHYLTIDLMSCVTVSQSDLAPYFSPQHLQGNGAGNQNRLPEGYYQFCFEVLEKNTGRLIGSKQCAQAYLTLASADVRRWNI